MRYIGIRDEILASQKGKSRIRAEVYEIAGRKIEVKWVEGMRVPDLVMESIYRDIEEELGISREVCKKVIDHNFGWMRSSMSKYEYSAYTLPYFGIFKFITRRGVGVSQRVVRDLEDIKGRIFTMILNSGTRHSKERTYTKHYDDKSVGCRDIVEKILSSDPSVLFNISKKLGSDHELYLFIRACCGCRGGSCWWHAHIFRYMVCTEIEAIGLLIGITNE